MLNEPTEANLALLVAPFCCVSRSKSSAAFLFFCLSLASASLMSSFLENRGCAEGNARPAVYWLCCFSGERLLPRRRGASVACPGAATAACWMSRTVPVSCKKRLCKHLPDSLLYDLSSLVHHDPQKNVQHTSSVLFAVMTMMSPSRSSVSELSGARANPRKERRTSRVLSWNSSAICKSTKTYESCWAQNSHCSPFAGFRDKAHLLNKIAHSGGAFLRLKPATGTQCRSAAGRNQHCWEFVGDLFK